MNVNGGSETAIPTLDGFRAIAISVVMLSHFGLQKFFLVKMCYLIYLVKLPVRFLQVLFCLFYSRKTQHSEQHYRRDQKCSLLLWK